MNKLILSILMLSFGILIFMGLANAKTEVYQVNTQIDLPLSCTINNALPSSSTTMNLTVSYPNGSIFLNNVKATPKGNGIFNYSVTFPIIGIYKPILVCIDGANSSSNSEDSYEITPTGNKIEDVGQISVGIIYFFLVLGFGLIFLGYLFLKSESIWVAYSGLFIMIIGSSFLYYDLHLSNQLNHNRRLKWNK